MTQDMAAQGDEVFYEGTIDADSERGREYMSTPIVAYIARCNSLLEVLGDFGITRENMDEHHKALARKVLDQINSESRSAIEQAALIGMVGTSMLATFDAQIDLIKLQLSVLDAEGGECHGN